MLGQSAIHDYLRGKMFTGLIEEVGEVVAIARSAKGSRLTIRAEAVVADLHLGDSIAVNGCCLTVVRQEKNELSFDLLGETLERTNLAAAEHGAPVNLERALAANARLGGHFVQGHIDCTGEVLDISAAGSDRRLEIAFPPEFSSLIAYKGSIALDGISLTVAEVRDSSFVVWIIPHTLSATNLRALSKGARVNLEFDILARYIARMRAGSDSRENPR